MSRPKWLRDYLYPMIIWGAIIALCFFQPYYAHADYLYTGAFSKHLQDGEYNSSHDLVAYESNGFTIGHYSNSYYEPTSLLTYKYRAYTYGNYEFNIHAGATYGYRKCYGYKQGPRVMCPYVGPELVYTKYKLQPVITFLGSAVVLSVRWEL